MFSIRAKSGQAGAANARGQTGARSRKQPAYRVQLDGRRVPVVNKKGAGGRAHQHNHHRKASIPILRVMQEIHTRKASSPNANDFYKYAYCKTETFIKNLGCFSYYDLRLST